MSSCFHCHYHYYVLIVGIATIAITVVSYYSYYYIWTELIRYGYLFIRRVVEFVMDDTYMILYVLMT